MKPSSNVPSEVLIEEIMTGQAKIHTERHGISRRKGLLVGRVVEAFNAESEPIDGVTIEAREVSLGSRTCTKSPIGRCAHAARTLSIPGQLRWIGLNGADAEVSEFEELAADACLFCGRRGRSWLIEK